MKRWLLAAVMLAGLANVASAQTLPKVNIGASGWQDVGLVDKGVTAEAIVDAPFVASLPKLSR
jgi:hypothetical protein